MKHEKNNLLRLLNVVLSTIFYLSTPSSYAQLTSQLLTCSSPLQGGIPFTIKFSGNLAEVFFKGNQFRPKFKETWVGTSGDKWTGYEGDGIIVSIVAADNWVSISSQQFPQAKAISICTVR